MARSGSEILTGLEIGTSSVKVVIGEMAADAEVATIHGVGECPSRKVMKGEITDVAVVFEQIVEALRLAEQDAGKGIKEVFIAITGGHIQSMNIRGAIPIGGEDRRITEEHWVEACRNARFGNLPPDKRELNTFDRRYLIDGEHETANPVNMIGNKFEAEVHLIYGRGNTIETTCNLVDEVLGYPATDMAFSALASSYAVLSPVEMERGTLVVDIGAGVTEYILFHAPGVFLSGQTTVGCNQLANDLAIGLKLPFHRCRTLLEQEFAEYGSAVMSPDGRNRMLAVPSLAGGKAREIPFSSVEQIVELRLRELFELIKSRLEEENATARVGGGVVVTGGGACIPGVDLLARQVFNMPVSIGYPRMTAMPEEKLHSPRFATPVGLLHLGRLSMEIGRHGEPRLVDDLKSDVSKLFKLIGRAFKW